MEVSGDVSLNNSTLSVGTSTFTTKGDLTATDGSFLLVMSGDAELKIGNNLKVSDSSIQVSDTGKLNVDGAATVNNTRFVVGKNSEFNVADDFTFTGKANFNAYSNAQVNVDGNFVLNTDNGDYNNSGVSDGAVLTVGNDLIVNGDSYLCNHDNATVNVKGNLELNNRKDDIINSVAYDNVQVNVDGDLKVKGGSSFGTNHNVDVVVKGNLDLANDGEFYTYNTFYSNTNVTVGKDFNIAKNSGLKTNENVAINVGGNLNVNNNSYEPLWNELANNTELTVNGDLNMKGQYKAGVYNEYNEDGYFKNNLYISGSLSAPGSSALIKGNVHLSDNSHFFTQTYSQASDDHTTYYSRDEFEQLSSTTIEGNVTVERNSRFGAYSASDTLVKGNVDITSGGSIQAWNSDAYLGIQGDVLVTDENSQVGVGRTADIDIDGKLTAKNGADVYIGEESTLSVAKKFLVDNATLEIHGGQLLLSGEDSVLDLTNNGVLKTDEAGSIKLSKGASVESLKETLLSDDTKTTAAGVAEKTFEADALSKVHLTNLGEVSLDEAERLHGVLFNSETGILDLKINLDTDENGNASFTDAIKVAGTTAAQDKTIADVDTSDKKLSDLTSSDLSWGSASLKDGQTDLDLGSGNLVLNNPEANNGSFVSTSDGSVGNITENSKFDSTIFH